MDTDGFKKHGKLMVDYMANYMADIDKQHVTSSKEPGYLAKELPTEAPATGEDFAEIMSDVDKYIMPGMTHWMHPNFHAYFASGNSYPSILADMLSGITGSIGFSWASCPAFTELEIIVLDWMAKLMKLPDYFLRTSDKGGGVIQGSASDAIFVCLMAARFEAIRKAKVHPLIADWNVLPKLVGYSSKLAHSCVEKAGILALVKMRQLEVDDNFSLRGETLERAIAEDRRNGLIPFFVCATLGTTSCCSFDNLQEIGKVCDKEKVWLHVDAAYAGSALILPEFDHLLIGKEYITSISFNPTKWMLVNFDCSLMWVRDRRMLTPAFSVDAKYLEHADDEKFLDFRDWGIPLSRRFRALKLWFVLRTYGVEGIQKFLREHIRLAQMFERYVRSHDKFEVVGDVTMGLVCFRLKGFNKPTELLLKQINNSGKLFMVPALINDKFVIRFAIVTEHAKDADIKYAWKIISDAVDLPRQPFDQQASESVKFDRTMVYDQQRFMMMRAIGQQNLFHEKISGTNNQ